MRTSRDPVRLDITSSLKEQPQAMAALAAKVVNSRAAT
jgi:hypothetical protein